MALNFPASPVDGQIYFDTTSGNRYVYDAATTKWSYTANNTPTGSVYLSASAPPGAVAGDLWWHQDLGTMFIFYNDGDSTQWVETSPSGGFSDVAASYQTINAAFGVANAAFDSANNVAPQVAPSYNTANAAYTQANAAYSFANGVATNAAAAFAAANNVAPQVTPAFNTANAAFDKANSANVLAYNTGIGANNYAGAMANGAGTIANAAFAAANAEYTFSNTIYAAVNSAFAVINAAYTSSNADYVVTNAAFAVANAAYGNANNLAISANAYAGAMANAGNAYTVVVGASSNTYANNTFLKLVATTQTITGDLSIAGNLSLLGGSTIISSNTLSIGDSLIYLAGNNYSGTDLVDIGFIANYGNATSANVHTGLIRDATNKQYYLFSGYDQEPANNTFVPGTNNMVNAVLVADLNTSNLTLGGANAIVWIKSAYDTVNAVYTSSNADYVVSNAAFTFANGVATNAAAAFAFANGVSTNVAAAFAAGNAEFTFSNTIYAAVNSAFGVINAAYTSSNADYAVSNAAFAKANAALANTTGTFAGTLSVTGDIITVNTGPTKIGWNYSGQYFNWLEAGGAVGNNYIRFGTGNAERMRLANGNLGINTSTPGATLHVVGDAIVSTNLKTNSIMDTNGASKLSWVAGSGSGAITYYGPLSGSGTESNLSPFDSMAGYGSIAMGDGFTTDYLAFNPPSSAELYDANTTTWSSTTVTAGMNNLFAGTHSGNWGAYTLATQYGGIRFTWSGSFYWYTNAFLISHSTQANQCYATLEYSMDGGSTWSTYFTTANFSSWPGYSLHHIISSMPATPNRLRLSIMRVGATNGNAILLGQISLLGAYGNSGKRLFNWDYQRRIAIGGVNDAPWANLSIGQAGSVTNYQGAPVGIALPSGSGSWLELVENSTNGTTFRISKDSSTGVVLNTNVKDLGFKANAYGTAVSGAQMVLKTSGSVGIGTTSPSTTLEVINPTGAGVQSVITVGSNLYTGTSSAVRLKSTSGGYYNWQVGAQWNVSNALEFTPSSTTGGTAFTTPVMTLLAGGNVGIGTTAPSQKLQVIGTIDAQVAVDGSDGTGVALIPSSSNGVVRFTTSDGSPRAHITGYDIGGGGGILHFGTNNTSGAMIERLRIDQAGNVGIGNTAPALKLEVAGNMSVDAFVENSANLTTSYTITTGRNAMTAGPVTLNSGVTITVPAGSTWTVV